VNHLVSETSLTCDNTPAIRRLVSMGDDALTTAKELDRPLFISIGYSRATGAT